MNSCFPRISSHRAFSLVELLVVIAIIGILAALSISAFTHSGQTAASLTGAGSTASGLAQLARQNAATLNTTTVLVLAEVNDGTASRSAISIWDPMTTNQIEKWNLLPQTVVATNTSADVNATTNFTCSYRNQSVTGVAYVFSPDGRVGDGSAVPTLRIQPRQGNSTNFYDLIFSPVTGTVKIVRP